MVKWPFNKRRSQRHDQASPTRSGGAYPYQDAVIDRQSQYSTDYVLAPYPGWPGPPHSGAPPSPTNFQATPTGYSPYAASPTVYAPSATIGPSYPIQDAYVESQRWRDTSAPAPEKAPYLEYTGSDKPTPEDLRRALFIPRFSPPPSHWRALIPLDPVPDANGCYTPPINRFPVELLSYVFTRCMDEEAENPFHAHFSAGFTPLVIARVCRLWRYVALDLPYLWQRFSLRPCQSRGHYRIARLFMQRTKGLGIYVHYAEDSHGGYLPERCPCALDLIIRNIGLVKALILSEVSHSTLARLSCVPVGAASSMIEFEISFQQSNISRELACALSTLYLTPTIREIRWSLPTFPENIYYSCITSLRLWGCPVDTFTFMRIMVSAPALQLVDVHLVPPPLGVALPMHVDIYHDAMEELMISADGPQDALMRTLHLPRLRRFHLCCSSLSEEEEQVTSGWPFENMDILYAFLGRLQDGLEYFILVSGGRMFDEKVLLRVMGMPQMKRLKMLDATELASRVGDAVFERLRPRRGNSVPPLLPHLEYLGLSRCVTMDGYIARMLESRSKYGYPLRFVTLGYPDGDNTVHDMDIATFNSLRKVGWDVFWERS
ncbi:hypothetical protein EV714DRAFT_273445 [Schizophyllum commune]